ncbi:MAG: hypothetical protein FJZ58_01985 [Chlamydiae bacterium]|nr:hypothetical protein [Chlamydiota bacterium]
MSIEKSRRVLSLCETSPKALACWGEALSFLGELSDQIDLIHEGQNKVLEALDQSGEDPLLWKAYGETYVSMGKYFEEPDYMYIAIEKFQQGLSIDRTQDTLWFAIGATYTEAGILLADPETLEKSLYFLSKAIDLRPRQGNYYFAQAVCLSLLGEYTHEEQPLESSIAQFEKALHFQKSAIYLHPEWLFQYAKALDLYAEFFDEESYYHRAIEIFSHVLMVDPDFPEVHYHLGLTHSHLGELTDNSDAFYKAVHFFKLALKHEEESDQILVDLGVTLINVAEHTFDPQEASSCFLEAESKLLQAAKTGNLQAYYQLACLASLLGDVERSLSFLYKAETFQALPAIEEMISDDWLEHTRSSASFATFLHYIERKNSIQEEL